LSNSGKRAWLAIGWAIVVGVLLAHTGWLWMNDRISPDTDILAMLPIEERDPVLQHAITHMADTAQQRLVVLVGAEDWTQAQRAADAYRAVLTAHPDQFVMGGQIPQQAQQDWLDQFKPLRNALLTAAQREALRTEPPAYWIDAAKRQLYSPFGGIKVGAWQDDPFGLFGGWVQARAQETSVRPSDGRLRVDDGKMHYVLLPVDLRGQAFSLSAQQAVMPVLQQAEQVARAAAPAVDVLAAGLILHAAAAGQQANNEMSTIGW
jgi:predicted exporter